MEPHKKTIILRHRRENLKKCSLHGLEKRSELQFLTYPLDLIPYLDNAILLTLDAPPLTRADHHLPLFLIDGTWKYAAVMEGQLPQKESWTRRSLPSHFRTAYPRKQTACSDPTRGLASVEALYIAHLLLDRDAKGLLDHYFWREAFLALNKETYPFNNGPVEK